MSPIHRKIKKAAESTEAEPIDAEPTAAPRRKWVIAFGIALALGLPGVLIFLSSIVRSHLPSDGPNSEDALFILILILIVIGSLLRILWRLRNSRKMSVYDLWLRMRFAIVLLVFGLALFAWLNMLWLAAVILILVGLFAGIYRLRRPDTEQEPNPTFDPRIRWPGHRRRRKTAAETMEAEPLEAGPIEWLMALGIALALGLVAFLFLWLRRASFVGMFEK